MYWAVGGIMAMQLIRPDFQNAQVDESVALKADAKVMGILRQSCFDCHSQEAKFPWYSNIAPISWVMSDHIEQGRKALDFSNWENMEPTIKSERLERAQQVIENQRMPKQEYTMIHENAVLLPQDKEILKEFFRSELEKITIR